MLGQPQPGKCFNAYKVKQTINGHTRRPFKEQLHREGKAQKKRQCRSGVGRFCGREKLPLFLPPRTSCLRGELYIELREWLNRQWSGSQCGRTLLREAGAFSQALLATQLQLADEKWVNFNWECLRVGQRLPTWGEASLKGWVIPSTL